MSSDEEVAEREISTPLAIVQGEVLCELPKDLYIPPTALRIFLTTFEGPFDLLLYLIKRQNLDILNIPIAEVTEQYISYIELMEELQLELAGSYLLMASMLAEIKSRMLLPAPAEEQEEADPRAELVRRLQEYERYQKAAKNLSALPRCERDIILKRAVDLPYKMMTVPPPSVSLEAILQAFCEVLQRATYQRHHHIEFELLSVRERMGHILASLTDHTFTKFTDCFDIKEGRPGAIVSLLAILELLKDTLIEVVQNEPGGLIYLKACT